MKTPPSRPQGCPLCWEVASRTMPIRQQTGYSYLAVPPAGMNADYLIAPKHHAAKVLLLPDNWHRQVVILLQQIEGFAEWHGYDLLYAQPTTYDTLDHVHVLVTRRHEMEPRTIEMKAPPRASTSRYCD